MKTNLNREILALLVAYSTAPILAPAENEVERRNDIVFAEPAGGVYRLLGGPVKANLEAARAASPTTYISKDDPPLLILHGDRDQTVYLDQSEHLKNLYEAAGLEVRLHVEPGAGHGWKSVSAEERRLVLEFLDKHLRHPD